MWYNIKIKLKMSSSNTVVRSEVINNVFDVQQICHIKLFQLFFRNELRTWNETTVITWDVDNSRIQKM